MLFLLVALVVPALAVKNCGEFCGNLTATCKGANIQYPMPDDSNFCMNSCLSNPDGTDGDMDGDSYACRVYHLGVANQSASNANTHCPHAGFNGGDGVCGEYCEAYCDMAMATCSTANSAAIQAYMSGGVFDMTMCMNECEFFPAASPKINLGSSASTTGNTRDCRMWHAQFAADQTGAAIATHCNHAAPQSGSNQCGNACDNYCTVVMGVCTAGNGLLQWKDMAQCKTACAAFPNTDGVLGTDPVPTSGDSVACRKYHAMAAYSLDLESVHCPHAGPLGGDVCGDAGCPGYCDLAVNMCPGVYTDASDCATKCATYTWNMNSTQKILAADAGLVPGSLDIRTCAVLNGYCGQVMDGMMCSAATSIQVAWSVLLFVILSLGLSM